jgi:hypothetical protein
VHKYIYPIYAKGIIIFKLKYFKASAAEPGSQTFFKGPQIANPKILGLIPLSQIRKVLRCVGSQIANQQIFINNSQIENPQNSFKTAQLCLKTVIKVVYLQDFYYVPYNFEMRVFFAIFVRRKRMYFLICGRFKSAKSQNRLVLQIANQQRVTFAEGSQIENHKTW